MKKISRVLYGFAQLLNRSFIGRLNLQVNDSASEKLNTPQLIYVNHNSVMDYRITSFLLRKKLPYHLTAKNQFAHRYGLMSKVGALPKVQFETNFEVIKNIKKAVDNGSSVVVFPEGVVSFDGTNRNLPYSAAKLVKFLKIPLSVMNIKGTYLVKPRYNEVFHKSDKIEVDFRMLLNKEQIDEFSTEEIYDKIKSGLDFNVWNWNKSNGVKVYFHDLTRGLDNLLYQCVECGGKTEVEDGMLTCCKCGRKWKVDEYYRLNDGEREYDIHFWFERQREFMRKELTNDFYMSAETEVRILDGYKGFKHAGTGIYVQTGDRVVYDGFANGKKVQLDFENKSYSSAPVGNDFIEFSQNGSCYRFYFKQNGFAIKSAVAIEESHNSRVRQKSDDKVKQTEN